MELAFVAFARSQGTLLHHACASRRASVEDPLDPERWELAPAYLETHLGLEQRSHLRSKGLEPWLMALVPRRTWEVESLHALSGMDFPEKGGLPHSDRMCLDYSLVSGTIPHVLAAETPRWVVEPAVDSMESRNHSDSRARDEGSSTPTRRSDCCSWLGLRTERRFLNRRRSDPAS